MSHPPKHLRVTLEQVFREHHTYVWRSLRRLGLGEGEVDDAVQDVFLVVHGRLDEFEFRASLRTWLFRIAMNVAQNYRRRRHRDWGAGLEIEPRPLGEQLDRREAMRILDGLLEQLSSEQRAVYVLSEVQGHSGPEIAQILEIELNTAYSRLRLARGKMKQAVSQVAKRQYHD